MKDTIMSGLVMAILANAAMTAGAKASETAENERASKLMVSVGDYRVVAEALPWKWGMAEYNPKFNVVSIAGKPQYLRLPRYLPVHASMPAMARHPLTGDIVLTYSPYFDDSEEYPKSGLCVSRDDGWTWTPQKLVNDLGFVGACGTGWISLNFYTGYEPEHPNRVRACVMRSENGIDWIRDDPDAIISFPEDMHPQPDMSWLKPDSTRSSIPGYGYGNLESLRGLYKNPASVYISKRVEEHDGILYACGYGQFAKDGEWRTFLIKSDDKGRSWRFFADMGKYYEPDFCWLANGDILAQSRCEWQEPRALLQTRSRDGGRTWSDPIPAPGLETVNQEDRTWKDPDGDVYKVCGGGNIDPVLQQMDCGLLVLAYGRPGLKLSFSLDGTGDNWEYRTEIIPKYAVKDGKHWAFPEGSIVSHHMSGMVKLSPRTVLVASNIYGYSPSGDPEKGLDVVFVVPVSMRRSSDSNSPPTVTGPDRVACEPGREIELRLSVSDPDGDWLRLICPEDPDVEIRGNAIAWRRPWGFTEDKPIKVIAEDAWGAQSEPLILVCEVPK